MPDVFESFFSDFGKKPSDYYTLERLDPGYEIYFGPNDRFPVHADLEKLYQNFEAIETGSAAHLKTFLKKAQENYDIAIKDLVYRPGVSPLELVTPATVKRLNYF